MVTLDMLFGKLPSILYLTRNNTFRTFEEMLHSFSHFAAPFTASLSVISFCFRKFILSFSQVIRLVIIIAEIVEPRVRYNHARIAGTIGRRNHAALSIAPLLV